MLMNDPWSSRVKVSNYNRYDCLHVIFFCFQKSIVLLRDPNNCLYPLVKDNSGGVQNPLWINLSSVTCLATGRKKSNNNGGSSKSKSSSQLALTLLVIEENKTLQAILASDLDSLKSQLEKAELDAGTFIVFISIRTSAWIIHRFFLWNRPEHLLDVFGIELNLIWKHPKYFLSKNWI